MKALLVVDMPTNCSICPCSREGNSPSDKWKCQAVIEDSHFKRIDESESIPEWCPLKPLPQKKEQELWDGRYTNYYLYRCGWNDCLDAITGETE